MAALLSVSLPFCFICVLSLLPSHTAPQPNHSQLPADALSLLAFKASLSDPLNFLSSWSSSSTNLSSWFGVSFSASSFVISIALTSCNLSGSISPVLGNLVSLQHLDLTDNNFTGSIPPELYGLPSLVSLNLSFNWLSGAIPRTFQRMTHLQVLDLNTNCLTGPIPEDIANSTELKILDLGGNSLTGPLPSTLGTLTNLLNLTAAGNGFTGAIPSLLGNLTKLQWLYLGWNKLTGGVPSSVGNLQNLILLDVSNNLLSGSIPSQLGNLKSLTELRLYGNALTGSIPPDIGNLKNLRFLDLAMNNLVGEIPTEISSLSYLELIHLNLNNLSGAFPQWLSNMPYLYSVYLFSNSLTGEMPLSLGLNNSRLQEFDVSLNRIYGSIPPHLCAGNALEYLILDTNELSGPIPSGLFNCASLIRLRLENNQLKGSLPKISISTLSLKYLRLCNNSLTGIIPAEIGNVSSLQALLISHNRFEGELPLELMNLQHLEVLLASQNRFVGSFPLHVCAGNPRLFNLQLDSNGLTGIIPAEIRSCTGLQTLYLNDNHMIGAIPEELGKLPSLGYLDLSQNELSGPLPTSLSSSPSLVSINVSFNNLSGPLPSDGVFRNLTESEYQGNAGLCGSLWGLQQCSDTLFANAMSTSKRAISGKVAMLSYLLPILCLILLLLLLAGVLFIHQKMKRVHHVLERQATYGDRSSWRITMFQTSTFPTCEEIWSALKEENVIGEGASGKVYKGRTCDGEAFVVKKLYARYLNVDNGGRGAWHDDHGYNAEVDTLGRIRHRNIVQLLCSVVTRENDLLVYEYMPNGSLADVLHDKSRAGLLGWDVRFRIAVEVAQALSYLHHDCIPQILHRDIKSSNILLDEFLTAHISDFGVAKCVNGVETSETMSVIAGSCGYLAPEYAYTLKASDKCDVYSFGVVLLELISGRKSVETGLDGQSESLVIWINRKMIQNTEEMMYVMDASLGHLEEYAKEESFWLLKVGLKCTSPSSYCRPSMKEVVAMLVRPKAGEMSFSSSSIITFDPNKWVEENTIIA